MTTVAPQVEVTDLPDIPGQPAVGLVADVPAAEDSPLASLRDRRDAIREKLYVDLKVPRWDDDGGAAIYVRYRPTQPHIVDRCTEKRREQKPRQQDWLTLAQADVLVDACVGVYMLEGEQKLSLREDEPHGQWTKFDPDLAHALGLTGDTRAAEVVRALYFTGGDVVAAVGALLEFSAEQSQQESETQGN